MGFAQRIYLDTNVYCRPLDDQKDSRICAETKAFLKVVAMAEEEKVKIVSSDYIKFEIQRIDDPQKRKSIQGFEKILSSTNIISSKQLTDLAKQISSKCKLNALDALHSAAACKGGAHVLLTCDDEILDHAGCIEALTAEEGYRLKVRNPIKYVQETEGGGQR